MVIWLIGMSGAGKTVIGQEVYKLLKQRKKNSVFLDGDTFRTIMGDDLGHTLADRKRNAERFCRMCKFLDRQEIDVVCSILSIFPESLEWNRKNYSEYFEVFVNVSFDELVRRDSKGLYKKALNGEIKNVVGVDIKFTPPQNPNIIIDNEGTTPVTIIAQNIVNSIKLKN